MGHIRERAIRGIQVKKAGGHVKVGAYGPFEEWLSQTAHELDQAVLGIGAAASERQTIVCEGRDCVRVDVISERERRDPDVKIGFGCSRWGTRK